MSGLLDGQLPADVVELRDTYKLGRSPRTGAGFLAGACSKRQVAYIIDVTQGKPDETPTPFNVVLSRSLK